MAERRQKSALRIDPTPLSASTTGGRKIRDGVHTPNTLEQIVRKFSEADRLLAKGLMALLGLALLDVSERSAWWGSRAGFRQPLTPPQPVL